MKSSTRMLLQQSVWGIVGVLFGFWIISRAPHQDATQSRESQAESEAAAVPAAELDLAPTDEWRLVDEPGVGTPSNAIPGEWLLHFTRRQDYQAYLKSLAGAGLRPLGQIDGLMVVRVGRDAMARLAPGDYGARLSYSYPVERPAPPVELEPEALASLRGFGQTARSIVGGGVDGDGSGVVVGILDSGIQGHAQFDGVSIEVIDLLGGGDVEAGAAHGTSVASIIAGSEGIAPAAGLLIVRVLDEQGQGNSYHVAEGIVRAVDQGVKVINLSLGVYQDVPLLREAVRYAEARGVLLVASAGNDGFDRMPYPAAYPEVLSVTAVDARGRQALFPNQSASIDFAAPGVAVLTAGEASETVPFSGTSAAAPFLSGTLAAMLSAEPTRGPQQTIELLKRYLNDAGAGGEDPVYGDGVIDWDRLRERDTPGVVDLALADIYMRADALPGTTMPIEVTVQNRGTHWTAEGELEVIVGEGEPVTFTIGAIGPGQTTTRKVFAQVPSAGSEAELTVGAQVLVKQILEDVRLENNQRVVIFRRSK